MKKTQLAAIVPVLVSVLAIAALAQQHATTDVDQVWKNEEAYWRYLKAGDREHFLALWSPDFVGWPVADEHPVNKAAIESRFNTITVYELHRESVDRHGSFVVTFYRATRTQRAPDGSTRTIITRISHTWMKRGNTWQIVAGMGAADSPPATVR